MRQERSFPKKKVQWLRMINSSQRCVNLPGAYLPECEGLRELRFDIQGISLFFEARNDHYFYYELHENGVKLGLTKPLGIFDRIRRKQAKIGLYQNEGPCASIQIWTPEPLVMRFDLNKEADQLFLRECEIMALSSGHHFENLDVDRFIQD